MWFYIEHKNNAHNDFWSMVMTKYYETSHKNWQAAVIMQNILLPSKASILLT